MIGSHEMSTTSMDINESFRPEDLSKTDFFDFVSAPDINLGIEVGSAQDGRRSTNDNANDDHALQGYDQFWGSSDKTASRIESAIFEDLDRYCWEQQHHQTNPASASSTNTSSSASNVSGSNSSLVSNSREGSVMCLPNDLPTADSNSVTNINADGHVYTLTVLNGNEQWLKRDNSSIMSEPTLAPSLDLDNLLGSFPAYVKSEFIYEDRGFTGELNEKDALSTQQHQVQQLALAISSNGSNLVPVGSLSAPIIGDCQADNSPTLSQFQNNNNDWNMVDNNAASTDAHSAESLLRSALQGKGYSKGLQLGNSIALMPTTVKEEDIRGVLFTNETDSLVFADSTLAVPMFQDANDQASQDLNATNATNSSQNNTSNAPAGIIVDDMFLSLDSAFTDDFEKIKRIANEVQQFCTNNDYSEVSMDVNSDHLPSTINTNSIILSNSSPLGHLGHTKTTLSVQPPPMPSEVTTSTTNSKNNQQSSTKTSSKKYKRLNSNTTNNNNNNSSNNSNSISTTNNNTTTVNNNNNNTTSPPHCNGQRKERSLHYCSICSKGFKDKYSVNVHIRTHTGEKPFACSLCGKSFRQKAHLAKHYQTHLAQKSNGSITKNVKNSNLNNSNRTNTNNSGSSQATSRRQISPGRTNSNNNNNNSNNNINNNNNVSTVSITTTTTASTTITATNLPSLPTSNGNIAATHISLPSLAITNVIS